MQFLRKNSSDIGMSLDPLNTRQLGRAEIYDGTEVFEVTVITARVCDGSANTADSLSQALRTPGGMRFWAGSGRASHGRSIEGPSRGPDGSRRSARLPVNRRMAQRRLTAFVCRSRGVENLGAIEIICPYQSPLQSCALNDPATL